MIFIEQKDYTRQHILLTLTLNTKNLLKRMNQDAIQELEVNRVFEIEKKEASIQELHRSHLSIVLGL